MDFLPTTPPRITRVRAKNFRSIKDIDIDLANLTILVGANGSGKSNVIDILKFVRDTIQRGLDQAILERHGLSSMRRWSAKGRPYNIYISIDIAGNNWEGEYSFSIGSGGVDSYKIKHEKLSLKHNSHTSESQDDQNIIPPSNIEENDSSPKTTTLELELNDGVWVENKGIDTGSLGLRMSDTSEARDLIIPGMIRSFNISKEAYDFYVFMKNMGFYTIYPKILREPQKPSVPHPLEEDGQNLASVLRDLKKNRENDTFTISSALENVVEGVYDYSVSQVGGYLVTRLHHHPSSEDSSGPVFNLAQESDGTLRMLGILTALYQNPPRSLVVIEEPELTIHPGALGVLCDVIKEASLRSQVIITTHNPDLIDRFSDEKILVVEKENGVTNVGGIISSQREAIREKLFSPGELMRIQGLRKEQD
ncbi:MAG: AAA family ATPase [Roseiflexaceae bacterium]